MFLYKNELPGIKLRGGIGLYAILADVQKSTEYAPPPKYNS